MKYMVKKTTQKSGLWPKLHLDIEGEENHISWTVFPKRLLRIIFFLNLKSTMLDLGLMKSVENIVGQHLILLPWHLWSVMCPWHMQTKLLVSYSFYYSLMRVLVLDPRVESGDQFKYLLTVAAKS